MGRANEEDKWVEGSGCSQSVNSLQRSRLFPSPRVPSMEPGRGEGNKTAALEAKVWVASQNQL